MAGVSGKWGGMLLWNSHKIFRPNQDSYCFLTKTGHLPLSWFASALESPDIGKKKVFVILRQPWLKGRSVCLVISIFSLNTLLPTFTELLQGSSSHRKINGQTLLPLFCQRLSFCQICFLCAASPHILSPSVNYFESFRTHFRYLILALISRGTRLFSSTAYDPHCPHKQWCLGLERWLRG